MKVHQVTVSGKVSKNENGFYWCLLAVFEGLEQCLVIDSSAHATYFDNEQEATDEMTEAGKSLAMQLATILNENSVGQEAFIVDKTVVH